MLSGRLWDFSFDAMLRLNIDLTKMKVPYMSQLELDEGNVKSKRVKTTELGGHCV